MLYVLLSLLSITSLAAWPTFNGPSTFVPVWEELMELFDSDPDLAGTSLRLAWHSAGTYIAETGQYGSNGGHIQYEAVLNWGGNRGLSALVDILDPIYERWDGLTRADLYMLAGVAAVAYTQGPVVEFCGGRIDMPEDTVPEEGLLIRNRDPADTNMSNWEFPNLIVHIRSQYERMGFNDNEMAALMTAHSIGRHHRENSGYIGTWDSTPHVMNNEYFVFLLQVDPWPCFRTPEEPLPPDNPNFGIIQYHWDATQRPFNEIARDCSDPVEDGAHYNQNPGDLAFIVDPVWKEFIEIYANDQARMLEEFGDAYYKLNMLGVTCDDNIVLKEVVPVEYSPLDILRLGYSGMALLNVVLLLILIVVALSAFCLASCPRSRVCPSCRLAVSDGRAAKEIFMEAA